MQYLILTNKTIAEGMSKIRKIVAEVAATSSLERQLVKTIRHALSMISTFLTQCMFAFSAP
jgi:hypothetical protein